MRAEKLCLISDFRWNLEYLFSPPCPHRLCSVLRAPIQKVPEKIEWSAKLIVRFLVAAKVDVHNLTATLLYLFVVTYLTKHT